MNQDVFLRDMSEMLQNPFPKYRILLTIDGPCCSGKTSLAEKLSSITGCAVIHTDDFVVPHGQKTEERLSVPGGNCDWERLCAEVIRPWKEGIQTEFRRYDCRNDRLLPPEMLPGGSFLILEGSYSNLPAIRQYADIRVFMTTPLEIRNERLQKRESPQSEKVFRDLWIPLENAYFDAYGLPDPDCIPVD